jgi:hypothetical protein
MIIWMTGAACLVTDVSAFVAPLSSVTLQSLATLFISRLRGQSFPMARRTRTLVLATNDESSGHGKGSLA